MQEEVTTTTEYYPPRPYAFSYEAGRYPNHVDRMFKMLYLIGTLDYYLIMFIGTHSEVGDGAGTVRGSFSYIDPRNEVKQINIKSNVSKLISNYHFF